MALYVYTRMPPGKLGLVTVHVHAIGDRHDIKRGSRRENAAAARDSRGQEADVMPLPSKRRRRKMECSVNACTDAKRMPPARHVAANVYVARLPCSAAGGAEDTAAAATDSAMVAIVDADARNGNASVSSAEAFLAQQESLVLHRRVGAARFLTGKRLAAPRRFGARSGW